MEVYYYDKDSKPQVYNGSEWILIPALDSWDVVYHTDGGSDVPSQLKFYGRDLTITYTKPSRDGYVFWHWNTKADNTETTYESSGKYTSDADIDLYAIWNPIISYNANGGTGAPDSQTKTYGRTLTLSSDKPTRARYVFKQWNTSPDDTGTAYRPSASYSTDEPMTLYAIWNPTIAYDGNGGNGAPSSQTKTYGQTIKLQTSKPSRTGYTFISWNTAKNGSGTSYSPGDDYSSEESMTLYAIWRKNAEAPTISSLSVVRCDSSGRPDDTGEYCNVTARWSVDTSEESGMADNQGTVKGYIKEYGTIPSYNIVFSSGTEGTSGTATAIVSGCDIDTQYLITIRVYNTVVGASDTSVLSTSRSDILTRGFFTMDFAAGGEGIGIGVAAPNKGLEIGMDTQFNKNVSMTEDASIDGNLTVTGGIDSPEFKIVKTYADIFEAYSPWVVVSQSAVTYGRICNVTVNIHPTQNIAVNTNLRSVGRFTRAYTQAGFESFSSPGVFGMAMTGTAYIANTMEITTTTDVFICFTFIKQYAS